MKDTKPQMMVRITTAVAAYFFNTSISFLIARDVLQIKILVLMDQSIAPLRHLAIVMLLPNPLSFMSVL